MAQVRLPGPMGFDPGIPGAGRTGLHAGFDPAGFDDILDGPGAGDRGVFGRAGRDSPGPLGGVLWQRQEASPRKSGATRKLKGFHVHPKSQISAEDWVRMLKANDDMPEFFGKQIEATGDVIHVKDVRRFKVPNDIIPIDWIGDWLAGFAKDEWEITTGCLDITVTKRKPAGKGQAARDWIEVVHVPDLGQGESVGGFTRYTMTSKGSSLGDISIEKGNTLPTGVKTNSGRKLIVIANRVKLRLGQTAKTLKFDEAEMVEVWFHEIACHAGRNSQGLKDTHGEDAVERCAKDIADRFPAGKTVRKIYDEIKNYLQ